MKRRISLVIALFVSFLLMFSPIAKAEETKFNTVTTSEPIKQEVVKISQNTKKADSPPQVNVKVPVIEKPGISTKACVMCPDGSWGRWRYLLDGTQRCYSLCN